MGETLFPIKVTTEHQSALKQLEADYLAMMERLKKNGFSFISKMDVDTFKSSMQQIEIIGKQTAKNISSEFEKIPSLANKAAVSIKNVSDTRSRSSYNQMTDDEKALMLMEKNINNEIKMRKNAQIALDKFHDDAKTKSFGKNQNIFEDINVNSKKTTDLLNGMGGKLLMAGTGTATLYAGVNKLKQGIHAVVDEGASYEQKLADLHALSGMSAEDLKLIDEEATKMSETFGIDAVEALDAYTRAINVMGISLAQNAPLLAEVGKQILLLAKSNPDINADTAAQTITTMFNQFGGDINSPKAADLFKRITNVIAAGSRQANAQPADISEAMKQAGPLLSTSKVSPEDAMAALEVLSQFNIKGEQAGTMIRNLLLKMSSGTKQANEELEKYGANFSQINPQVVGLVGGIEKLKSIWESIKDPVSASNFIRVFFGVRAQGGAQILMRNVDVMEKMSSQMSGTDMAKEQADIRMGTFESQVGRGHAKAAAEIRELFKETKPEIESLVSSFFQLFIDGIKGTKRFIGIIKNTIKEANVTISNILADVNNAIGGFIRLETDRLGITHGAYAQWQKDVARAKAGGIPGSIMSNAPANNPTDTEIKAWQDAHPKNGLQNIGIESFLPKEVHGDVNLRVGGDVNIEQSNTNVVPHAKGGITKRPIFTHVAGEAGNEAIAPIGDLMQMIIAAIDEHDKNKTPDNSKTISLFDNLLSKISPFKQNSTTEKVGNFSNKVNNLSNIIPGFGSGMMKEQLSSLIGSIIPGGGIITNLLGSLFHFSSGADSIPRYYANGINFVPRGTDTIPAMVSPGERIFSTTQNSSLVKNLEIIAKNTANNKVLYSPYAMIDSLNQNVNQRNFGVLG